MNGKIGKVETVRRQLEAAATMVLDGYDLVPVHTILHAAQTIIRDVAKSRSIVLALDRGLEEFVLPEYLEEARKLFRKPGNFFKHADRDADEELELPDIQHNDATLSWAIIGFSEIDKMTDRMGTFLAWWQGMNPRLLKACPQRINAEALHLVLKEAPRAAQLAVGRTITAMSLIDNERWDRELEQLRQKYPDVAARYVRYENSLPQINNLMKIMQQELATAQPRQ